MADPNQSPIDAGYFDGLYKMMTYHNERMQDRRSLGMKVFTGVVILYLLVANVRFEHPDSMTICPKLLTASRSRRLFMFN
jgi:hypothetical protein